MKAEFEIVVMPERFKNVALGEWFIMLDATGVYMRHTAHAHSMNTVRLDADSGINPVLGVDEECQVRRVTPVRAIECVRSGPS